MNRDALLRHWENLEQQFAVLLDRLANIAPDLDVRGVQHYLDHNEFGLALEQLGWVLVERHAPIPISIVQSIEELARRMTLAPESFSLSELQDLAKLGQRDLEDERERSLPATSAN
jgi:hypothetical protein